MNHALIRKLRYSRAGQHEAHPFPLHLKDSLQLISDFFATKENNKLCLVFPTKEFAAQWLSIPTVLFLIESDFAHSTNEIAESLKTYKKGDKIILNNDAVVEWVGKDLNGFKFKHREFNKIDEIIVNIRKISKIQPAPPSRKALSSYKSVIEALNKKSETPTDKILGIQTDGNKLFQKNSICLISKHISFENSISEVSINDFLVDEYFKHGKIDDSGESEFPSPLLISNNLTNLALYLTLSDSISSIIIDGYSAIQERGVDFNDIDVKKIPTILITDLSEIESFGNIGDYGFDFFNFTKQNLQFDEIKKMSPFYALDEKLRKYTSFSLLKEHCNNLELERVTKLIHSIEKDDSVKELVSLKFLLIQLTNRISRITHPLHKDEVLPYNEMLSRIESHLFEHRFYLGGSVKAIEESILILKLIIEKFAVTPSEKCARFKELMRTHQYDYIICSTEDEARALGRYVSSLSLYNKPKVISVADVNNSLISTKAVKAILTGWAKSSNINRILSSFLFSELTILFYKFESEYFNSLQKRNKRFSSNVKSTINQKGIRPEDETRKENGYADLYFSENPNEAVTDDNFDIVDFELKLDRAQFSKFIVKGNQNDSVKAKRVEFKNDKFIYLTDTHGLLVLENFYPTSSKSLHIHKSRIENLQPGDVIAFIKTERELLNKVVGKQTTPSDLAETIKWIELWKHLLRNHYKILNNDFNKLVTKLKEHGCSRDQVTIRSWLFDDLRIGPRKDDDLISIAIMTNGTELYNNIKRVRTAIRQMTSWRMRASDFVIGQLKEKIKNSHSSIQINSTREFEDLGDVEILEITEINHSYDNVDIKNVNRLLEMTRI